MLTDRSLPSSSGVCNQNIIMCNEVLGGILWRAVIDPRRQVGSEFRLGAIEEGSIIYGAPPPNTPPAKLKNGLRPCRAVIGIHSDKH